MRDIAALGAGVDWRRSFITTARNPYYDSFIRWQFEVLRKQGRIEKATRCNIRPRRQQTRSIPAVEGLGSG